MIVGSSSGNDNMLSWDKVLYLNLPQPLGNWEAAMGYHVGTVVVVGSCKSHFKN